VVSIAGKIVSPGYAAGWAFVYREATYSGATEKTDDMDREVTRLQRAVVAAKAELEAISYRVRNEFGSNEAEIFLAHREILNDPLVLNDIEDRIRKQSITAEAAINQSIVQFAGQLAESDNLYLREREQDIRDVGKRLGRHMGEHSSERYSNLEEDSIIVAEELMPSDLVELDYEKLVGIVTSRSGATSHVAILARSLGIPAISGITNATKLIKNGQRLFIDGDRSMLVIDPGVASDRLYRVQQKRFTVAARDARAGRHLPCCTTDGTAIALLANLGKPNDQEFREAEDLDGVGLLRTEFLFLDHLEPPSISRQVAVYESIALHLPGKELNIRTLDLGGDKYPLFLESHYKSNPVLGVRGIRHSLVQTPELFEEQLAALLTATQKYPINVLLPMVIDVGDYLHARERLMSLAHKAGCRKVPPLGVLIETPSAVFAIDDLVEIADFICIGTNDLTQFMLAEDRNAPESLDYFPAIHPAVLRAIKSVVEACTRGVKSVTVCGEIASVPELAAILIGLGVRRLSMSPITSAKVHEFIRKCSLKQLEVVANDAVRSKSIAEVHQIVQKLGESVQPVEA